MSTTVTDTHAKEEAACEILGCEKHTSLYSPELAICAIISPLGVLVAATIIGLARTAGWKGAHRSSVTPCKDNPNGLDSTVWVFAIAVVGLSLALVLSYIVPNFYIPKPCELPASDQLTEADVFAIRANFFWIMNICGGLWVLIRESISAYRAKGLPARTSPFGIGWRAG